LNQLIPQKWVLLEKLSASQEIPRLLWNSNVHYRVHKSPILSYMKPTHTLLT